MLHVHTGRRLQPTKGWVEAAPVCWPMERQESPKSQGGFENEARRVQVTRFLEAPAEASAEAFAALGTKIAC